MDTLLEMVDNYIRENGIPFENIFVSRSCFPEQFNKMLEIELKKLNPKEQFDKDYQFKYDKNGNLILVAKAFKTNIVLADNIKEVKVNFPCTKMYFDKIFDKSCVYKYNLPEYKKFKNIVRNSNPNMDEETIEETTSKLIEVLDQKIIKELNKTNEDIYDRDPSLLTDYVHTVNLITGYIEYLNNEYKKTLILDTLIYNQREEDREKRKNTIIVDRKQYDKKYSVISVDDRIKMLEENGYMYKCQARKRESNSVDTLCYLYMLGNNDYEIIIEPYSGEGRTKVIELHKENEFTYADFKMICMEYLEYSNKECLKSNNIAMFYHTTKETFGNSIKYAITRNENLPINEYTKINIDTLSSADKSEYSLEK